MKQEPASRLGPYEILGKLGAGGMGEVYRARDTRLHRDVALKILPPSAAADPERQRRFAQEAIAAGALNHPNILAVYDVGVEGGVHYLVSELVDGAPLRDEMQRGRLALKRLLDLGVQMAHGLAAAHGAGIVHRDLKPENIMVTRAGRVKIVDFGLAKSSAAEGAANLAGGTTQTATGLVVGTVPYMSPEQASGEALDYRSDQFSLGLVLYEMASGGHPFKRPTAVQTLSAVIADEPRSLAELKPPAPVPLRWLIERCLSKAPADRFSSTADLAADLQQIRDRIGEITAADTAVPRRRSRTIVWATSLAALALVAALVAAIGAPRDGSGDDTHKYTPLATDAGYQGAPAWSPDGKTLAYVADVDGVLQVFTRSLTSTQRAQVTHLRFDCHDPFWSPDGTRIYFHSLARDTDSLWAVSPAGGPPELILPGVTRAAMSPDGRTLAVFQQVSAQTPRTELGFSSPPGAPIQKPMKPFDGINASDEVVGYAPDGSALLLWVQAAMLSENPGVTGFWLLPKGGEPRKILPALSGPRAPAAFSWFPDSRHIVVMRADGPTPGGHLWVADIKTNEIRPLTVTNGNEGSPAVAPDGRRLAFTSEATDFDLAMVPLDGGPMRPFLSSTRNELDPAWSPASAQYAFVTDRTGRQEIWLRSEEGAWERPLVTDADFGSLPTIALGALAFSPDGQRLAYQRFAEGGYRIWISAVAGGPALRLLTSSNLYQDAPAWSPDGDSIAFMTGTYGQWSMAKVRVGRGDAPATIIYRGVMPFARPAWSPDGRFIACQAVDGLIVVPADGGAARVLNDASWLEYAWAPDGARLYGLRPTDDLHHFLLASIDAKTGRDTIIHPNLGTIPQANQPIRGFSRVRGEGFLTSIARVRSDIWLLEGFRIEKNPMFFQELLRRFSR